MLASSLRSAFGAAAPWDRAAGRRIEFQPPILRRIRVLIRKSNHGSDLKLQGQDHMMLAVRERTDADRIGFDAPGLKPGAFIQTSRSRG